MTSRQPDRRSKRVRDWSITVGALALMTGAALAGPAAAPSADSLRAGFETPPNAARPRVWWHWMDGNVALDGAKLDLEWMQRIGVGGVHTFSGGGLGGKPMVAHPQPFMSAGWRDVFRETTRIAHDAGMEVSIAGSPGWSQTGGVWVAPRDAMKKYVWSETRIEGGQPFDGVLAGPPATTGPFQGVAKEYRGTGPVGFKGDLYGDSLVIAFPTPATETGGGAPTISTASGPLDLTPIATPALAGAIGLPFLDGDKTAWVQATYDRPATLSAIALGSKAPAEVEILVSDDGHDFRSILRAAPDTAEHPAPQRTYAFKPVSGRVFRVVLTAPAPAPPLPDTPAFLFGPPKAAKGFELTRLSFEQGARIDRFEAKAGFQSTLGDQPDASPAEAANVGAIAASRVIDLTSKMGPDGRLAWTPPVGSWTVLRFGWSLTGATNGPAEPEATGLEVDKLDAAAVGRYIDAYLKLYDEATGGKLGASGVENLLTDSWEAGVQNWTPGLLKAFQERRGYDPTPFLPVLAGRVVESAAASDRFLWDYRQTLKDLLADNHYAVLAKALHARGMGYYSEAQGDTPRAIGDGMTMKSRADIPTAEYWYRPFATAPGQPSLKADLLEAASVAHVYGRPFVAAESLTVAATNDMWGFAPAMLKPVADEIFAHGVNRILMHESHQQPFVDGKPGLAMAFFGQFFNRNDTWAEQAGPWVEYLSRTSYLLQQGRDVSDVAYFYGEERNLTELFHMRFNTDVPEGYRYDYINPDGLRTQLAVEDGRLISKGGAHYRVLYMPAHVTHLTLPTLRKLASLVNEGAILVGARPIGGLGLQSPDAEVLHLVEALWGPRSQPSAHAYGRGRVYGTSDLAAGLAAEGVGPDIAYDGRAADAKLLALHRRDGDADIYFVSNQKDRAERFDASFRVKGKVPELWNAETGRATPLSYRLEGDRVRVPLELGAQDARFVVFRKSATAPAWQAPKVSSTRVATIAGPWTVGFEAGRGAPASATLPSLSDWTASSDPGIKYFSGAATYQKRLEAPRNWFAKGQRLMLDLGDVRELAVVTVNGKVMPTAWRAPYKVDVSGALKPGRNDISIKVVNLWTNRLIGDKQPGAKPVAFAPVNFYQADAPLRPSGLLGPVTLQAETLQLEK